MSEHRPINLTAPEASHRCVHRQAVDEAGKPIAWIHVHYFCPGCRDMHNVCVERGAASGPRWTFNGNVAKPTFAPSVNYTERVCHHYVRDGRIEFLGDCTHAMKGSTVDLPTLDKWPMCVLIDFAPEIAAAGGVA